MSAPVCTLPLPIPALIKKKRVLLIDTSQPKRDLRAETMRKLGMDVDCAADVAEARCWWRADLYDLVLINVPEGVEPRDRFCDDMRRVTPGQQIMFLVGKPEYLAAVPCAVELLPEDPEAVLPADSKVKPGATTEGTERWGILEACKRISAVRNLIEARSKAIRSRPLPPRDSEMPHAKRTRAQELLDQVIPESAL